MLEIAIQKDIGPNLTIKRVTVDVPELEAILREMAQTRGVFVGPHKPTLLATITLQTKECPECNQPFVLVKRRGGPWMYCSTRCRVRNYNRNYCRNYYRNVIKPKREAQRIK